MVLDIIIGLLSIFATLVIIFKDRSLGKRMKRWLIFSTIAVACLSFLNILSYDKFKANLIENQECAARLQQELICSQDSLKAIQENMLSFQTSEDCYIFLEPAYTLYRDGACLNFDIVKIGDWPVYDVSIKLIDMSNFHEISAQPIGLRHNLVMENTEIFYIPVVSTPYDRINYTVDVAGKDWMYFSAEIRTRNGAWLERLAFQRIGDHWKSAIRLSWLSYVEVNDNGAIPLTPSGVIYEDISPEFPVDSLGNPIWLGQ